nr:hypothetical protein [Saprospiraceae bacterium]
MEKIILKRDLINFYVPTLLIMPLMIAGGIYLLFTSAESIYNGAYEPITNVWLILGLLLISFSIFFIYHYFKITPMVVIQADQIKIGGETHSIWDLTGLDLSTPLYEKKFTLWGNNEGARLRFEGEQVYHLYDTNYDNLWELKTYLHQRIVQKKPFEDKTIKKDAEIVPEEGDFQFFFTPLLKSKERTTLVLLALMLVVAGFQYFISGQGVLMIAFTSMPIVFFLLLTRRTYYFGLSKKFLLVKNSLQKNRKDLIPLKNIREVVPLKSQSRRSLLIVFPDFSTRTYTANTLSEKNWVDFFEKLKSRRVKVRS